MKLVQMVKKVFIIDNILIKNYSLINSTLKYNMG